MRQFLMLPLLASLATCVGGKPQQPPLAPELRGPNMSGLKERRMANCPSAVPGAITQVELTPDGVNVTVTSPEPDAQRTIVALAEFHARTPRPLSLTPHVGLRGGGSRIGYCPMLHDRTTVTATPVPSGVRIGIHASSPDRVKELQQIILARAARFPGAGPS